MTRPSPAAKIASRALTVLEMMRHLLVRRRYFLIPFLLVLLLAGTLLLMTEAASYITPFMYTIF